MDEADLEEPATATAAVEDVVKYVKGLALVIFEENHPCDALEKVIFFETIMVDLLFILMTIILKSSIQ